MSIEKNNNISNSLDSKKLLEELSIDIAKKYGIEKEKLKKLVKSETLISINSLKDELKKSETTEKELSQKQLEELFFTLKGTLEVIEKSSKIEIKHLKKDVEKTINIDDFKKVVEEYLPKELLNAAKNPKNPFEHILGGVLGTTNSIITPIEKIYNIGKGIINTPYHLYLIFTGKATTDSFKKI